MPFIQVQNSSLSFTMRRSRKAKRLQMLVQEQQFEIVAPMKVKNSEVLQFIKQTQKWMLKQTHKSRKNLNYQRYWPEDFLAGEVVFFRGRKILLNVKYGDKVQMNWHEENITLTVPCHRVKIEELTHYTKQQLLAWYQQQAFNALEITLAHFCPLLGRWPAGYKIKTQKTRWGSCGKTQHIHINWLLILAPFGVFEYVVVHELCHLFHRNHGKRFWAKVASLFPEYEKYEAWLSKYGHLLQPSL